jgi:hypothetical protein
MARIGLLRFITAGAILAALTAAASAQVAWTMRGFDLFRTGANMKETVLKPANVNTGQFGKLFTRAVDGQIYAQPMVVPGIQVPNKGTLTVVYVATMHDSIYAFDAENAGNSQPLWKRSFIDEANGIRTIPYEYLTGYPDIHPEVGIVGTPAIDVSKRRMYVVVRTVEGDPNQDSSYHQRLYALDLRTGATIPGSPVEISAQVSGTGDGAEGGVIKYNPRRQNQRPALVLNGGKIYIASASHGDNGPYHGWILAYDATTLTLVNAFCSTPNAGLGGFWMSGHAMPVDAAGNLYAVTGNGNFNPGAGNFGDSVLKINGSTMAVADYFTPYNQADLEGWDADLGSCGPILLPGTFYLVAGSKEGKLYVMNTSNMGKFNAAGDSQIVQWWWAGNGHMHGTPVYWRGMTNGNFLYMWSENDRLKGFKLNGAKFITTPFATSDVEAPPGMPGGFLTVSANGTDPNSALVWATVPFSGNANWDTVPGVLRAFRATDLKEVWNSRLLEDDDFGMFAKFNPPVVVNGKVYVATFSNQLAVYGQLPPEPPIPAKALVAEAGDGEIALTWRASRGAASYEIRRGSVGGPYDKIAEVSNETIFVDKACTNGTTYAYTIVAKNAFGNSDPSNEASDTPRALSTTPGTGITGFYFNDSDANTLRFLTQSLKRTDKTIDFDWAGGSPSAAVTADHFSVIWAGWVTAKQTGYHTFQTVSDDGVRLWVQGRRVLDNWTDHAPVSDLTPRLLMVAGKRYAIQMELYENAGGAVGRLLWTGPGIDGYVPVPITAMYPVPAVPPVDDGILDLANSFNQDAISTAVNPQDGDIGYQGQTLAGELVPAVIDFPGVGAFQWRMGSKLNGAPNVVQCDGRTVTIPATSAARVNLLGCAINDTQAGLFRMNYSDGTSSAVTMRFTDWGAPSPRNTETVAIRFDRRNGPAGPVIAMTSLYRYALPVDKTKRLVSITLPNNPNMKIFAVTVRRP